MVNGDLKDCFTSRSVGIQAMIRYGVMASNVEVFVVDRMVCGIVVMNTVVLHFAVEVVWWLSCIGCKWCSGCCYNENVQYLYWCT